MGCVSKWMKIIILIIIRDMHVEYVSKWVNGIYIFIYITLVIV